LPDAFLQLPTNDRKAILLKAAQDSGKGANVLEKDVWVCWTLEKLVKMPDVPSFAFKGGTSLSKVYNAIARFSEDVDVTLDRMALDPALDPFADKSNSQRKKDSAALDELLTDLLHAKIKPYFDDCLRSELDERKVETTIGDNHGLLVIPYPSCFDRSDAYVRESVLLELGGKNSIQPAREHPVKPYLADLVTTVEYPEATIPVLAAERTFWEKATLIHAECNRPTAKVNANRISRHWYDLAQLSVGDVGASAINDKELLNDVILQKNVLYYSGFADYEACSEGALKIVPDGTLAKSLSDDFERMKDDGMFWEAPGTFANVLEKISKIESQINRKFAETT